MIVIAVRPGLAVVERLGMGDREGDAEAGAGKSQPTPERQREWLLIAKRAIEASLELTDELEAA